MMEFFIPLLTMLGTVSYLVGIRRKAIVSTCQTLARDWVNEGDIHSVDPVYFTLKLENTGGNLIGSLTTNTYNTLLGVYADVGWFNTTLHIFEKSGKEITTVARLKRLGHNHMEWSIIRNTGSHKLPTKTVLWPCTQTAFASNRTMMPKPKPSAPTPQQPILSNEVSL